MPDTARTRRPGYPDGRAEDGNAADVGCPRRLGDGAGAGLHPPLLALTVGDRCRFPHCRIHPRKRCRTLRPPSADDAGRRPAVQAVPALLPPQRCAVSPAVGGRCRPEAGGPLPVRHPAQRCRAIAAGLLSASAAIRGFARRRRAKPCRPTDLLPFPLPPPLPRAAAADPGGWTPRRRTRSTSG